MAFNEAAVLTYTMADGKSYTRQELIRKAREQKGKVDWKTMVVHIEKIGKFLDLSTPHELNKKQDWTSLIQHMNRFRISRLSERIPQPPLTFELTGVVNDTVQNVINDYKLEAGNSIEILGIKKGVVKPVGVMTMDSDGKQIKLEFNSGIPNLDYSGFYYNKANWEVPKYRPNIQFVDKDTYVFGSLTHMLKTGKYPAETQLKNAAERFLELYNELRIVYNENYFGSGGYSLQLARKAAVDKIGQKAKLSQMHGPSYNKVMDELFPIRSRKFRLNLDESAEDAKVRYAAIFEGEKLFNINNGADAGPLFLRNGVPAKCGEVLEQMDLVYNWFIEKMKSKAPPSDYNFLSLVLMKPKEEVYARKKGMVRNIYVYNNPVMRLAMMFYNIVCSDLDEYGPDNKTVIISGKTLFKGGMDHLIKSMMFRAKRDGVAYAVYSDNLTIVTMWNDVPVLISLDGEKFEATITAGVIEQEMSRMIKAYEEVNGPLDTIISSYLTILFPKWGRNSVAVLNDQQIPTNQMASGLVGTFRWNSVAMCRLVNEMRKFNVSHWFDFTNINSVQMLPSLTKLFEDMGVYLTIESSTPLLGTYNHTIPVDILGFDALLLQVEDTVRYVPVLQRDRLLKMLAFAKTDTKDDTDLATDVKWRRWMVEYSRMIAAYMLGGWADTAISALIYKVLKTLFKMINRELMTGQQDQVDIKAIISTFISDLEAIDETNVLAPFFRHITNEEDRLIVPTLTQVYELAVGPHGLEEFITKQMAAGVPYSALLTPDEMERLGIAVKKGQAVVTLPEQAGIVLNSVLNPLIKATKTERPTLGYALSSLRHYKPTQVTTKPVTRKPSTGPTDPHRLEVLRDTMAKLVVAKGRKLALLVPTPSTHKLSEEPLEKVSKLVWTNLYRDLANYFKVKYNDLAPYQKFLGSFFLPTIRIPPKGYPIIGSLPEILTVDPGVYQFNYMDYEHELMISETTVLAPRIDFSFYARMGYTKEEAIQTIKANEPFDYGRQKTVVIKRHPTKPLPTITSPPEITTKPFIQARKEERAALKESKQVEKKERVRKARLKVEMFDKGIETAAERQETVSRIRRKAEAKMEVKAPTAEVVDHVDDYVGKYETYANKGKPNSLLMVIINDLAHKHLNTESQNMLDYMVKYVFGDIDEEGEVALNDFINKELVAVTPYKRSIISKQLPDLIVASVLRADQLSNKDISTMHSYGLDSDKLSRLLSTI